MQSNFSEFMNVTGAAQRAIQNVASGELMIYRGVTYVRKQQSQLQASAHVLPTNTTLHYRGATYRLEAPVDSSAAQAQHPVQQKAASWLVYRGVPYQVHRIA